MLLALELGRQLLRQIVMCLHVDGRPIGAEALTEVQHPLMILIELRPAGEGPEWDVFVDVGIAGVVADLLRFDTRPGGGRDDLARLGLQIPVGDLLLVTTFIQMAVIHAGLLGEGLPRLVGHLAVGLGRHAHHRIADTDVLFE